ncbi:MAG: recombination mediator RecR [Spirochaetales bacterium]|jgi:recombination protein RecR|nr:recombination mediator RecR [Spirochaetales bacterium]
MKSLDTLVSRLTKLPGIGRKSALRIAYHLLRADSSFCASLAESIAGLRDKVKTCPDCGSYTEEYPCPLCADPARDRNLMCVVEQPQDIEVLESTGEYRGIYHVLGGVISPLEGIGPQDLSIGRLLDRIKTLKTQELILATNPTVEGDTTALYLVKLLENLNIKVSRLALGLPVGGDLEYADRLTLTRSLRGRTLLTDK